MILVDYSNLAYLSLYGSLRKKDIKPEEIPLDYSDHVKFFTEKIGTLLERCFCKGDTVRFILDQVPVDKFTLFPDYKTKRTKLPISPKTLLNPIIKDWGVDGWHALYSEEREADDVIAAMVSQNPEQDMVIISSDKDLWQVKEFPNVEILNPLTYKFIDQTDLYGKFGIYKYKQIKLCKSLWGDASDAIPNAVPRMQKQLLPIINKSSGDLEDFYEKVKITDLSAKCRELLKQGGAQVAINYKLVQLDFSCKIKKWTWEKGDKII